MCVFGVLGPRVTGIVTGIVRVHGLIHCTLLIYESGVAGPRAQYVWARENHYMT